MKIAIAGTRQFRDQTQMNSALDRLHPSEILHGGAEGADALAASYGRRKGLPVNLFLPMHKIDATVKYHPRYFLKRTEQMLDHADMLLAAWDGQSKGTAHAIKYARKKGLPVEIIEINPQQLRRLPKANPYLEKNPPLFQ